MPTFGVHRTVGSSTVSHRALVLALLLGILFTVTWAPLTTSASPALSSFPAAASGWWDGFGLAGTARPIANAEIFDGQLHVASGTGLLRWDGASWELLATAQLYALLVFDSRLVVAGNFAEIGGVAAHSVAAWDGDTFAPLGEGIRWQDSPGTVRALTLTSGDLLAGGQFTHAGDVEALNLARWNGSTWSSFHGGITEGTLQNLAAHEDHVLVTGSFVQVGGVAAQAAALWDGGQWMAADTGLTERPSSAGFFQGIPLVGLTKCGEPLPPVLQWTGTSWAPLGNGEGLRGCAYVLHAESEQLLVGGRGLTLGSQPVGLARWNGMEWSAFGPSSVDGAVRVLASNSQDLFLAGDFRAVNDVQLFNIARWDGSTTHALGAAGQGLIQTYQLVIFKSKSDDGRTDPPALPLADAAWGHVSALAIHDGALVAAGFFDRAGATPVRNVAQWRGGSWQPIGGGLGGMTGHQVPQVRALTVWHEQLVAGGGFAGGLAMWDGQNWVLVGDARLLSANSFTGGGMAKAVVEHETSLVVGGIFAWVNDLPVSNLARWDGLSWHPMDNDLGTIESLTVHQGTLIAAGSRHLGGGSYVSDIARWTGESWQLLATADGIVWTVVSADGGLLAGGAFQNIGGVAANGIARWNGDAWQPLGSGMTWEEDGRGVQAIWAQGARMVAAGHFETAGGETAQNIAMWQDGVWTSFEEGITFPTANDQRIGVRTLASHNGSLFAGGVFSHAGGFSSSLMARFDDPTIVPVASVLLQARPRNSAIELTWSLEHLQDAHELRVWRGAKGTLALRTTIALPSREADFWVDTELSTKERYRYQAEVVTRVGDGSPFSVWSEIVEAAARDELPDPMRSRLLGSAPNPMNPSTRLRFELAGPGDVRLDIVNAAGRRVRRLTAVGLPAGSGSLDWDGRDRAGKPVASGVYLVRLITSDGFDTGRVVVVR